jgi:hypothetical protein
MKKLTVSIFLFLVLSCLVLGQRNDKPKASVIWSRDANCHQNNTPEVKALRPQCSSVQVDTMTFYIVNYAGVWFAMTHRPSRDYLVASVQISNKSDAAIQVNPLRSKISRFQSVDEFIANSKGNSAPALSQDALRQASYRESTVIPENDGGIRAGLRVEERYEDTVNRSGRVVSRVTRLEPAAPPSSKPTPSIITNSLLIPSAVFDNIMKSKTIAAGEKVAGHVVFRNPDEEKVGYTVFYLNAGEIEFVFPAQPKQGP